MEIEITNNKLRKAATDLKAATKQYGAQMAKKLHNRIAALKAANSLGVFWPPESGPERCHELRGDAAGTFTVDLVQPYRLLFQPIEDVSPKNRSNEQERWNKITKINISAIEDTHE
jgi:plasmid maintenance system killer protein